MPDTTDAANSQPARNKPLCCMSGWMFILAVILGVCCLFFMSIGGMTLCILHCVLGSFIALANYNASEKSSKVLSILAIIGNTFYLVILLSTFVCSAWLVALNVKARNDYNKGSFSSFVTPLLTAYMTAAGDSNIRRLSTADELFSDAFQGPTYPTILNLGEPNTLPVPLYSGDDGMQTFSFSGKSLNNLEGAANVRKLQPLLRNSMFSVALKGYQSPTVLLQQSKKPEDLGFTDGQLQCLLKLTDDTFKKNVAKRLTTMLDWGLFCGYTQYSVASMRKWGVSCKDYCHFDELSFRKYGDNTKEARKEAEDTLETIREMDKEDVQVCMLLSVATACRIEETHLATGVLAALFLALVFTFVLFFLSAACIISIFKGSSESSQVAASN